MRPNGIALARWPAYFLLALGLMVICEPRTDLNPRSRLPDMILGTAWRPYVKRTLVGWTVRATTAAIPRGAQMALATRVERSPFLVDRWRWQPGFATWFALVFAIHLGSLVLFAWAFERWFAIVSGAGPTAAFVAGLAGLALLPLHFGYQNFVYDFPALALFTLGLLFLARRSWIAFYVLWPIGLLNKETFLLLAVVFAAFESDRMPRRELARHVAAQLALALVVLLALAWIFRANPGPPIEYHLARNLRMNPPPRQLLHDVLYWGFVIFALSGWRTAPRLTAATLGVGALLFGSTLFFGFLGEYRDFYEAWPLVLGLALVSLARFRPRARATFRAARDPARA